MTAPDRFAKKVMRALRRQGVTAEITYDPEAFTLSWGDDRISHLNNVFAEYSRVGFFAKRTLVKRFALAMVSIEAETIPDDFSQAAPNILPRVREMSYYGIAQLSFQLRGMQFELPPLRQFADSLAFELVFDTEHAMATIGRPQLETWGVTFDDAYKRARANMRARSREKFIEPVKGLYVSPWQDNHDCGRLALFDVVNHLDVEGEHIAMPIHRDLLVITGSESIEGLAAMISFAQEGLQDPRSIAGVPIMLAAGGWTRFDLPEDHPLGPSFRSLATLDRSHAYAQQKELLEAIHTSSGDDVFVATLSAVKNDETDEVISYSVWSKDVPTLLPRSTLVSFFNPDPDGGTTELVPWARVEEEVGDLMRPRGLHPERYFVEDFPSPEQIARMRE